MLGGEGKEQMRLPGKESIHVGKEGPSTVLAQCFSKHQMTRLPQDAEVTVCIMQGLGVPRAEAGGHCWCMGREKE